MNVKSLSISSTKFSIILKRCAQQLHRITDKQNKQERLESYNSSRFFVLLQLYPVARQETEEDLQRYDELQMDVVCFLNKMFVFD